MFKMSKMSKTQFVYFLCKFAGIYFCTSGKPNSVILTIFFMTA